jgi:hypothetical protein
MSSRQPETLVSVDFFTTTHRISGQVQTGPRPFSDLLNDQSSSYLLVFNVYVSPLTRAAEVGDYAPVAYLSKENLCFAIVSSREIRAPDRSHFSSQDRETLITMPRFEVRGMVAGPRRLDIRSFSPTALDPFIVLTDASVQVADNPEMTFSGEAILVNRARLEGFCLAE